MWPILAAGFVGMFLCGGPVYAAASRRAIHIALIMALSPVTVLMISAVLGIEQVGPLQWLGTALALAGALLIISGGHPETLFALETAAGDGLVVIAMLGWSGYTLLQSRAAPKASLLARMSLFAGARRAVLAAAGADRDVDHAGAGLQHESGVGLRLRRDRSLLAYAGFAWLGGKFGSVRTSLVLYLGPIASALLSFAILGEPPKLIHLFGGVLILGGVWASLRK